MTALDLSEASLTEARKRLGDRASQVQWTFAILGAMRRLHAGAYSWIWIALIAFLAARLGDAHLHLCFDGQEPATAVHMADGSVHNDAHHVDKEHSDRDVDVLDALLAKKVDDASDIVALVPPSLLLLIVEGLKPERPASAFFRALPHPPFRLRPPLRGPPA